MYDSVTLSMGMDSTICNAMENRSKGYVVGIRFPSNPECTGLHKPKLADVRGLVEKLERSRNLATRQLGVTPPVLPTCEVTMRASGWRVI